MMENGFSSPRTEAFPAGLRVLVVDDDPTWLKILEKMLKKCSYEVTTCGLARDALLKLRERKDGYDIVISDVNMPDMDGFKLLEHVGLEMDLPVIMMSVDGETSRVMKGVQHGACDYLLKPIRMKELRNIWQHVLRKRLHEVRDIESLEGIESIQMSSINGSDQSEDAYLFCGDDLSSMRKRKDDKDLGDTSSNKKARVVWSVDLHQKFVRAVNQIGYDKVGPKKILDLMNVPWLTRENVASHLQKYRLYLSRLQKESDQKPSVGGVKHSSDSACSNSAVSFNIQSSANLKQNDVSSANYGFSGNTVNVEGSRSHDRDRKGTVSLALAEPQRTLTVDVPHTRMPKGSRIDFSHPSRSSKLDGKFSALDSSFSTPFPWGDHTAEIQLKQEQKPLHLDNGFRQQPALPRHHQQPIKLNCLSSAAAVSSGAIGIPEKVEPLHGELWNNVKHIQAGEIVSSSSAIQTMNHTTTSQHQVVDEIPATTSSTAKNQCLDLGCIPNFESMQRGPNLGLLPYPVLDEDLQLFLIQGGSSLGLQNMGFPEYLDPGLVYEDQINLFDATRFDRENNLYDPTECQLIDQGLFIS
ncbi:unnamed protein product [Linum tenue]|uniref:Two-component response regulator n=1 Tax=Linum tenue TaxID=586396 RepID=A0AAV0KY99_9ROSI|nr:unnamed protein product [Linum tenue]